MPNIAKASRENGITTRKWFDSLTKGATHTENINGRY